jgi:protein TonB
VAQFLFANVFGVFLAVVVFGILPGLQIVTGGRQKTLQVRDFSTVSEPPPPDTVEEEPPPPEDVQDEPPPPMDSSLPDLSSAMSSINPVGGGGAAILGPVGSGAIENAMASFGTGDLDQKPSPMTRVAPKIPRALARQRLSGQIDVEFVVDTQGRVQSPRVVRSFNTLLNEPVLSAIRQWRFKPGMRGGKAVPFKTKMPFKFDN